MKDAETTTYGPNGFMNPLNLFNYLVENKPINTEPCFTHGDYCLPNIFNHENELGGFIDLGRSGIGDKWFDISLCVRSLSHNLGTHHYTDLLFDELGLD